MTVFEVVTRYNPIVDLSISLQCNPLLGLNLRGCLIIYSSLMGWIASVYSSESISRSSQVDSWLTELHLQTTQDQKCKKIIHMEV
jgi:hypothetical protein